MKLMKLTVLSLAIITANSSNADYQVRFYLDPQHINLYDYNVDGNISLSKTTINRGESSTILWNYKYANEIEPFKKLNCLMILSTLMVFLYSIFITL